MIERLRKLALDNFATSPAELRRLAKLNQLQASGKDLVEALKNNQAVQVLAPKQRYAMKSAAETPGSRIQADLAEFPHTKKDTDHPRYALVATDVYTRQIAAEPMKDKTAGTTDAAMKKVLARLPNDGHNASVSTDKGKEFARLGDLLEERDSIHRLKQGRNDISVVDAAIGRLKFKLANAKANVGGSWDANLQKVATAYNNTPKDVVHGTPANADRQDTVQGFLIAQDNGEKFAHNKATSQAKIDSLYALKAFRPPISDGSRQHKPRYGKAIEVGGLERGALRVADVNGEKHLLKRILPVDENTAEPLATFGTGEKPKKRLGVKRLPRKRREMTGPIPEAAASFDQEPASSSSSRPVAPVVEPPAPPAVYPNGPKPPLPDGLILPLSLAEVEAHPELEGWYFARKRDGTILKRGPKATDASWNTSVAFTTYQKKARS